MAPRGCTCPWLFLGLKVLLGVQYVAGTDCAQQQAVREQAMYGADWIKSSSTAATLRADGVLHWMVNFTEEEKRHSGTKE